MCAVNGQSKSKPISVIGKGNHVYMNQHCSQTIVYYHPISIYFLNLFFSKLSNHKYWTKNIGKMVMLCPCQELWWSWVLSLWICRQIWCPYLKIHVTALSFFLLSFLFICTLIHFTICLLLINTLYIIASNSLIKWLQ